MFSARTTLIGIALSLLLSCEVHSVSPQQDPPPATPPTTPEVPISIKVEPKPEPPKPRPPALNLSPYMGKETAKITLIAFTDYQCPYCNKAEATIKELQAQYGDELRVVWKDLPLVMHKSAKPASIAARAAGKQGNDKFVAMHNTLFTNQTTLPLDASLFEPYAVSIPGLDIEQWKKDVADPATTALVDTDLSLATTLGITGTPGFFVNGEFLSGAQSVTKFQEVFNRQKLRAEELLAKGTAPEDLYEELVSIGVASKPKGAKLPPGVIYKVPVEATAPPVEPPPVTPPMPVAPLPAVVY